MSAADDMVAQVRTNEHQSANIAPGPSDEFGKFDEQLRTAVKDFQRASDDWKSVEDMQDHLSMIDRRLNHEASERRAIQYRLMATEREVKRQHSLKFARYLAAICIGVVAGALAWQSYGQAAKQIIATRAPELGWSTEAKQMIAGWMEQLGWTKQPPANESAAIRSSVQRTPQAALVAQTAPNAVTPSAGVQQAVEQNLAAVRESLKELAARQDQMEHDITKLQAVDMEILAQSPSPLVQPATPARNAAPVAPPLPRRP